MKLQRLTLKNFKGHEHFTLKANGNNISIYGDNGAGKTTIADAYCLLLCGTDSKNTKSWSPKPNHRDGSEAHGLVTEVEGVFSEPDITLKLTFKETYTKDKKLSGHKTEYYVDEGKCATKKEYEDKLKDLVPADAWYILDPLAFAFRTEWKKRRDVLMKLAGDIEVPMSDDLSAIIGRHDVSTLKNIASTKKSEFVKERATISPVIEELKRQVANPDVKTALKSRLHDAAFYVGVCEKEAAVTASEEEINLRAELNSLQKKSGEVLDAHAASLKIYQDAKRQAERELSDALDAKQRIASKISTCEQNLFAMKKELAEIKASEPGVCGRCNQPMPVDKHAENKEKAIEKNIFTGKKTRVELIALEEARSKIDKEIHFFEEALTKIVPPAVVQPVELNNRIEEIKAKLSGFGNPEEQKAKLDKLKDAREKHASAREELARLENSDNVQFRIEILKSQEKSLSDAISEQDGILDLCNQHTAKLVTKTAEAVNRLFTNVTWKMFNECINGEPQECCEALVNGQPFLRYSSGGETINAGMDIIRVLRGYYKADLPIFVDNAESVTRLFNIPGAQVIRLVADINASKIEVKEN